LCSKLGFATARAETLCAVNRHGRGYLYGEQLLSALVGEKHLLSARALRSLRGCRVNDPSGRSQTSRPKTMCCGVLPKCVFLEGKGATFTIDVAHLSTTCPVYFSTARNWVTSASRPRSLRLPTETIFTILVENAECAQIQISEMIGFAN